jgi:hypothetical protein
MIRSIVAKTMILFVTATKKILTCLRKSGFRRMICVEELRIVLEVTAIIGAVVGMVRWVEVEV